MATPHVRARLDPTLRLVASRYPNVSVYDRIVDTPNFAALLEFEALTNPRIREEAGNFRRIRPEDRISGPGTTPIMASFAYAKPGRFNDETFGVYYAGLDEETAIAERRHALETFYRYTHEPEMDLDQRVYQAVIEGTFADVRVLGMRAKLYAPNDYSHGQTLARELYEANIVDGIVYKSVRRDGGECVAAFRPRVISECRAIKYVQFRWNSERIVAVADITNIRP